VNLLRGRRKCSTNCFAGRGSVLKLRAQIASLRFAQGSRILIIMIGMDRAQRLAAASGTTAMPTPAATIWQFYLNSGAPGTRTSNAAQEQRVVAILLLQDFVFRTGMRRVPRAPSQTHQNAPVNRSIETVGRIRPVPIPGELHYTIS
jgi:hypothetical protein